MSERSIIKVEDGKIKYTGKVKLPDGTIRVQPEGGIKFIKNKKDGGLAEAIEKVKAKEMKDGGGVKMGPKIPAKIKDPVKVKPIPKKIAKKLVGFEKGGEAVPSRFKGFSKLPEEVQKKMDPALAERFEDGGAVKMGSGGGVCKGMGIARAGGKFKIR